MSNILEISELNISSDNREIIRNFNLSIENEEWIGVKGPSGSGKSTILKYLAQLLDPSLEVNGNYYFKDKSIYEYEPVNIRQKIAYCFQDPSLFGKTVYDNLAFPFQIRNKTFDKKLANKYLTKVGLDKSYLNKKISTLSGGEKQRISLIRSLIVPPEIILLDEVSSSLDKNTRGIVWDWLKEYKEEYSATIVMVTHLDEEYELADRVINVDNKTNEKEQKMIKNE